jgi:hypothetical protein
MQVRHRTKAVSCGFVFSRGEKVALAAFKEQSAAGLSLNGINPCGFRAMQNQVEEIRKISRLRQ